jgi:hypothetical protein
MTTCPARLHENGGTSLTGVAAQESDGGSAAAKTNISFDFPGRLAASKDVKQRGLSCREGSRDGQLCVALLEWGRHGVGRGGENLLKDLCIPADQIKTTKRTTSRTTQVHAVPSLGALVT